ncbi:hypothetical protein N478_11900 [Pseudoalteromonas luteoviolacea S4060-1]|uniref:Uncharacterized protein n=1 Tax=Pseudoalteromonas luteoviolacea S4060-1 TaxID=1365257 RepID=A0A161Z0L7_9GAMM|nr:hypothetical protein N478_11900 [Pseudoalteromonas luteoviolacea S4060-1]
MSCLYGLSAEGYLLLCNGLCFGVVSLIWSDYLITHSEFEVRQIKEGVSEAPLFIIF